MPDNEAKLDVALFKTNPNLFIEKAIKTQVAISPLNILTTFGDDVPIYDEPVVVFGNGDDPIFTEYKTIIGDFHMTPREVMGKYLETKRWRYGMDTGLKNLSVISWAMPMTQETRLAERQTTYGGSRRYNNTRWMGVPFINNIQDYLAQLLELLGCNAVSPGRTRFAETRQLDKGQYANWSERHIAYACGMGTFGLNGLMLSPKGCAVYLASVVCDLPLNPTPRKYSHHMEYCLFHRDGSCRLCIERCQGHAISEQGRTNNACRAQMKNQIDTLAQMGLDTGFRGPAPACGLCSTGVPCENSVPD